MTNSNHPASTIKLFLLFCKPFLSKRRVGSSVPKKGTFLPLWSGILIHTSSPWPEAGELTFQESFEKSKQGERESIGIMLALRGSGTHALFSEDLRRCLCR
jgi:hypothetical protein